MSYHRMPACRHENFAKRLPAMPHIAARLSRQRPAGFRRRYFFCAASRPVSKRPAFRRRRHGHASSLIADAQQASHAASLYRCR